MFKVISPKGNLITIERVARVCEKRIEFNAQKRDFFEVAKNADVPATGIALKIAENTPNVFGCTEIYIGNLKAADVNNIITKLMTEGYVDFSAFTYQDVKEHKDIILDEGKTVPFSTEFTNSILLNRMFTSDTEMFCRPLFGETGAFNNSLVFCEDIAEGEFCEDTEGEDSEVFD